MTGSIGEKGKKEKKRTEDIVIVTGVETMDLGGDIQSTAEDYKEAAPDADQDQGMERAPALQVGYRNHIKDLISVHF